MKIIIENIVVKPYVRMTQRGKFVKKNALEYLASKTELQSKIISYMNSHGLEPLTKNTPLIFSLSIHVPVSQGYRADLDNIVKAVLDGCNKIVFDDDRYINEITATRWIDDKNYLLFRVDVLERD